MWKFPAPSTIPSGNGTPPSATKPTQRLLCCAVKHISDECKPCPQLSLSLSVFSFKSSSPLQCAISSGMVEQVQLWKPDKDCGEGTGMIDTFLVGARSRCFFAKEGHIKLNRVD